MRDHDDRTDLPHATEHGQEPTPNKPLHGPRRPTLMPILLTLAVIGLAALIYFIGLTVLVPSR